ncbi:(Fe-S)-binding protein [Alicyclobacillus sp. TC]|uniref:L-lactate dehydrogenase complex protein LldE n=1 Tax=Alicyclobacillus tolerans TaxID=90970 RepID=A0A1M6NKQ8_9BACL|nr:MULTISPECIES: (Fe-S)-binding protein [Alicyclobacillus]QRF23918.1 (Fe-S)-binding protein [Alicyclobacillus sp. TC]SHJ96297.1 L-lactate dehydrogenase complex protein LldE [Alicyclobacillus montanus]
MKVSLFITCMVDSIFPQVGVSMTKILQSLGCEVLFPSSQTCCGQPAFNSGYSKEARSVAISMINAFQESDVIVSPSGSCVGMIRHFYPELFSDSPEWHEKALSLANRTYEFSQFLIQILKVETLGARFPYTVTYHPSCHGSRLLGIEDEPIRLLKQVEELQLIELPYAQDCCGFGGTFAVKMSEISGAMVEEKTSHVLESGASVLVGTDMGCLMNIGGRLSRKGSNVRVMHLAELLYEGRQLAKGVDAQ